MCSGPGEIKLPGKGVGNAVVIPTQLSASRDWHVKRVDQKLKLKAGFPGARADVSAAGVSSNHQEQHSV